MELSGGGAVLSAIARIGAIAGCCLALAHCGQAPGGIDPKYGVSASPRLIALGEPVPKGGGVYRVGKPYTIAGVSYSPEDTTHYSAEGIASWYGEDFHGRQTANGEIFDMTSISAAHPTLPIPSYARVTNLANHRSIIVRVNDRGPYHQNRLIDVSMRTAKLLGFYDSGTARVRVDYVGRASLDGSDDRKLEATLRHGGPAPGPAEMRVASTRAFLPRSGGAAVPLPADRPFDLGEGEGRDRPSAQVAARPAGRSSATRVAAAGQAPVVRAVKTASAAEPDSSFAARFAPARDLPGANGNAGVVSAFASDASANGAVVTGRGLY
jgi:rare lipoprotein A